MGRGTATPNRKKCQYRGIASAARDKTRVHGWTHNYYRYPARFSPVFARSVIETYSDPGDWVIDPFVGGGTTLVEAMALGRNSLGIDVSALATFVCRAKTLVLSDREIRSFESWLSRIPQSVNMRRLGNRCDAYAKAGYYRNLEGSAFWRIRKAIEQSLASAQQLRLSGSEILARCAVLRTAQWALDGRKTRPSVPEFREKVAVMADEMLEAARAFRRRLEQHPLHQLPRCICLHRNTAGAHIDVSVRQVSPPRLILTSPPYPGIHILYHRWQIDGRREAPAPFWIAGEVDGAGSSYYTMGDRKHPGLKTYFDQLEEAFRSVAAMAGPDTTIVQVVAFSDADWQLPRYLEVMDLCGLLEDHPWYQSSGDGRLWRDVPNRKWHALQKSHSPGAKEVVLVHRKKETTRRLQAPQTDCQIPNPQYLRTTS